MAERTGFMPKDDSYEDNEFRTATLAFLRASETKEGAFSGRALATFKEDDHKFSMTKGFPVGVVPLDEDGDQYKLLFGPEKAAVLVRTVAKTGTVMLQGMTTAAVSVADEEGTEFASVPTGVRVVAYKAKKLNADGSPSKFYKSGGQWTLVAEWGHSDGAPGADNLAQFGLAGDDLPY